MVLLGLGDGTFGPETHFPTGMYSSSITIGDFNGDGRQDLAVLNNGSDDVSILLGIGDGTFGPQIRSAAGYQPSSAAIGDFNGDGHQDMTITNPSSNEMTILSGRGDGTFGVQAHVGSVDEPGSVIVADFDRDGRLDLAVTNRRTADVSVIPGRGDGSFAPRAIGAVGPGTESIAIGNFNGDRWPDVASANLLSNDVSILLGLGDGTFLPQSRMPVGESPRSIASGDFNKDGHTDLAVVNSGSYDVSILLGRGDGTFAPETRFLAGSIYYNAPTFVAVGDFNGDKNQDLAVIAQGSPFLAEGFVAILLGRGDGTFASQMTFSSSNGTSLAIGDFNGDGKQDLALTVSRTVTGPTLVVDEVAILLGLGDGSFASPTYFGAINGYYSHVAIAVGDFNGDGKQDLALVHHGYELSWTPGDIAILLGLGDGTFGPEVAYGTGPGTAYVVVGDFDRDGRQDLAAVNDGSNDVSLLLGVGDGTFSAQGSLIAGDAPVFIAAADLNADGNPDLVVANARSNDVWSFLNRRPPADTDGDGVPDNLDNCPTVYNPDQNPEACRQEIVDIGISFSRVAGKGSGIVTWSTTHEVTLLGFNVVLYDQKGARIQLNSAPISCKACTIGTGETYTFIVPKHKSGKSIFIEGLCTNDCLGPYGPAVRQ